MEEIGAYDRGSSDESRQSDGGSDDDIKSKEPESGFGSEGEAEICDNEGAADGFRVQSEIENEEMEQSMDDDDETTDSRTEPINESMQLRKLAKLASEFNKTVNEIRERSRQQAFQFPRDEVSTSNRRKKRMGRSESGTDDNDMSDSISSQLSRTPRKRRIAKWEVLSEIQKSEHTKEEPFNHFAKIAKDELAKGGPIPGFIVKEGDLGGFRRNRVSIVLRNTQSSRTPLIFIVAQIYKSVAASHAGVEKIQWTCPSRSTSAQHPGNEVRGYCDSDGPVCCKTSGGMAQTALQQVVTRAGTISPARSTGAQCARRPHTDRAHWWGQLP